MTAVESAKWLSTRHKSKMIFSLLKPVPLHNNWICCTVCFVMQIPSTSQGGWKSWSHAFQCWDASGTAVRCFALHICFLVFLLFFFFLIYNSKKPQKNMYVLMTTERSRELASSTWKMEECCESGFSLRRLDHRIKVWSRGGGRSADCHINRVEWVEQSGGNIFCGKQWSNNACVCWRQSQCREMLE